VATRFDPVLQCLSSNHPSCRKAGCPAAPVDRAANLQGDFAACVLDEAAVRRGSFILLDAN
jgi:hypothetical protein